MAKRKKKRPPTPKKSRMDPQIAQLNRVLNRVRAAWKKHGGALSSLNVFVSGRASPWPRQCNPNEYHFVAGVFLPLVKNDPEKRFTQDGECVAKKVSGSKQAAQAFTQLAAQAGSLLPETISEQLSDYVSWQHTRPESLWVALLCFTQELTVYPNGLHDSPQFEHLILQPFAETARLIQRLIDNPFMIGKPKRTRKAADPASKGKRGRKPKWKDADFIRVRAAIEDGKNGIPEKEVVKTRSYKSLKQLQSDKRYLKQVDKKLLEGPKVVSQSGGS